MLLSKLVAPVALAATVLADGAAVNTALKTVDKSINALTATLTGFSGNIFGSLPVLGASLKLKSDIQKATKAASSSQDLTSDETLSLAETVGTIITDATKSIDAFIAVKPKFDKLLILTPIAAGQIKDLKTATVALGDAIVSKVPAELKDISSQLIGQINAQFDRGSAAYGGSSRGSLLFGLPGTRRSNRLERHI
ncbi:Cell wall mannoprotein 1 [Beauveria bassiana]|nr:Cell wall mannoprotein 1 [Beauveria bassiana]KAH8709520.1 Cell wall mannoprotein 1 [Beauveria bassiana]